MPELATAAGKVEDGKEDEKPPPPPIGKLLQVQFIPCSAATRNTITLDRASVWRVTQEGSAHTCTKWWPPGHTRDAPVCIRGRLLPPAKRAFSSMGIK